MSVAVICITEIGKFKQPHNHKVMSLQWKSVFTQIRWCWARSIYLSMVLRYQYTYQYGARGMEVLSVPLSLGP